jgi:VWFA-related protein
MNMRRAFLTIAAVGSLVVSASGQQPQQKPQEPPTFRSSTRLVVQTVTVKDKSGRVIEGLTAKDFVVTEENQPQEIAFVEFQRLVDEPVPGAAATATPPAAAPAAPPAPLPSTEVPAAIAGGIAPPTPGDIKYRNRRLIVLYFDNSATFPPDQIRAYDAALKYISTNMQAADLIAIMTYGGGAVRVKQDFTDDKAKLRQVIEVLMYGEDKDGDGVRDPDIEGTEFGQNDAEFNVFSTDRQLAALQTGIEKLRPFPEQKSLVYFASNLRLNGTDNNAQQRATTNAAIRANVQLYPVDARGLVAMAPLGDATQRSPGGIGMFTGALATAQMSRFQRSQDTLYSLAKDTGGKAMFDFNDLSLGIVQAAEAQGSYYIIGYYSTHIANDGKFRRVKVSLANNREGELAFRQGYYADKEWAKQSTADRERQLEEALMLDNPITDMTVALELNYFQLNSAEYFVPIAVKIPGRELAMARQRGAQRITLDFIAEIKDDPYGITYSNMRDKVEKNLADSTVQQLAGQPIHYETGFTLLPGKYMIKFLARDAESGRIGTFQTKFVVPNLDKELQKLPISTVVLGSQRVPRGAELANVNTNNSKAAAAQAVDPLIYEGEKLLPSVTRVFSTSQDLHVYLQAYEKGRDTMQPLVAFVSFFQGDVKVFETEPLAVVDGMHPRSKAVPLRFSIPLQKLPPGRYDCQVAVMEPSGQKVAFWQAPIAIVP